jgi:hypothetical protein
VGPGGDLAITRLSGRCCRRGDRLGEGRPRVESGAVRRTRVGYAGAPRLARAGGCTRSATEWRCARRPVIRVCTSGSASPSERYRGWWERMPDVSPLGSWPTPQPMRPSRSPFYGER